MGGDRCETDRSGSRLLITLSDIDVAALPRFSLDPETALWRIHPEDHGPWWCPGTLKKRFSLERLQSEFGLVIESR